MTKCKSIERVDRLMGTDVLHVTLVDDNIETTAYWMYDYTEALKFLDQEVLVSYRKDMYKGELCDFINTFTVPTVVKTLDKNTEIKLYLEQCDNMSNVTFREIEDGDERLGCIVFCTNSCYKSSPKASWMELTIRDHTMHCATLRLFDYDNKAADFSGKYIKTSLSKNQYGFQTTQILPLDQDVYVNPEIELAISFIKEYFEHNATGWTFIQNTHVLDLLAEEVDYEKGYGLMRLAMELSLVQSLKNISNDADYDSIGLALLLQRGYLTQPNSVMSKSFTNINTAWKYQYENKKLVMQLLDDSLEEKPVERNILDSIKAQVSTILEVRKGVLY